VKDSGTALQLSSLFGQSEKKKLGKGCCKDAAEQDSQWTVWKAFDGMIDRGCVPLQTEVAAKRAQALDGAEM
jgi:hypothetical protein